jgi:hypothetical protein
MRIRNTPKKDHHRENKKADNCEELSLLANLTNRDNLTTSFSHLNTAEPEFRLSIQLNSEKIEANYND